MQQSPKISWFEPAGVQGTYARSDWLAALERAVRFGAYSLNAVERILAAQAQPRSVLDIEADRERQPLPTHLTDNPVTPRPLTDYPCLLEQATHAPPSDAIVPDPADHSGPATDAPGRPA